MFWVLVFELPCVCLEVFDKVNTGTCLWKKMVWVVGPMTFDYLKLLYSCAIHQMWAQ